VNSVWLDFEKPIVELEKKIQELKALESPEIVEEITRLEKQAERLRKKIYSNLTRWQRVQLARHPRRPYSLDIINLIVTDFVETHGDRLFADDNAIVAGLGQIDQYPVVIIAEQKGRDIKEKIRRNFGSPHPEGYRKALRLFYFAQKFSLPVICLVDTPGAYPGVGAEERGQAEAIARNMREMSLLETPIVVVIIGEGCSGGAIAIALGDRVFMFENSYYSVISPEGCASILWRDSTKAQEAAEAMKITAQDLLALKIIDRVIPEPVGGAHRDWNGMAVNLKQVLVATLDELTKLPTGKLIEQRVEKYRRMGIVQEG
jgi:acetyl-CoA carboxylase carboxyl transferase subunit alpha